MGGGAFCGANDERMHPYQRGRASIKGLGLWLLKIIETERLVVVVTARLVRLCLALHMDTASHRDSP